MPDPNVIPVHAPWSPQFCLEGCLPIPSTFRNLPPPLFSYTSKQMDTSWTSLIITAKQKQINLIIDKAVAASGGSK